MTNQGSNLPANYLDGLQKYLWTQSSELLAPPGKPFPATLLNVSCQVETLQVAGDRPLLIICARPPKEAPDFGTCFPLLPGVWEDGNSEGVFFLRFLRLENPLWVYIDSSQSGAEDVRGQLQTMVLWQEWSQGPARQIGDLNLEAKSGLYMWGNLPSLPSVPGLNGLFEFSGLKNTIAAYLETKLVKASVTYPDAFPVLTLQFSLVGSCDFGPGKLGSAAVVLKSPLYFSPHNSQVGLMGELDLDKAGKFDIEVDFPIDGDLITASGKYRHQDGKMPFVDTSELSKLPVLQAEETIDIEMQFSKRDKTLKQVSFALDLDNWSLIDRLLTLNELHFLFAVYDPLASTKYVTASIAARASFGTHIKLICQGDYPSGQFYLGLDSATSLTIKTLSQDLLGESRGLPDLTIHDLSVEYNMHTGYMFALVDVSNWVITDGFELSDLRFKFLRFLIQEQPKYDCQVAAAFSIANVTVQLDAQYHDGGWQFSGSTGPDQEIPIGHLINDLGKMFGAIPLPSVLEALVIENLHVSFNTKTKDFTFKGEAKFPVDDREVDITVAIDITHQDSSFRYEFSGQLTIGALRFDLHFLETTTTSAEQAITSDVFVATYSHTGDDQKINIRDLIGYVSSPIADLIPASLEIDLKDVLFGFSKNGGAKFLFGLDIGADLSLSNLPLVGQEFPPGQTLAVDDLQLLVASQDFTAPEVIALNKLLPEGVTRLPIGSPQSDSGQDKPVALGRGLHLSAIMKLGDRTETLILPPPGSAAPAPGGDQLRAVALPAPAATGQTVVTSDKTTWFKLQKTFGPVHFERIGCQYQDQAIWFLLDAALSAAGLTLSLDGLSFGSSLTHFEPRFDLHGLGLAYQGGPVEIGGAFLRVMVDKDGLTYDEYDGTAVIKTKALTLSAIGSYAYLNRQPSLFIYAFLDYPLGGPSFFYVTGLAAGFGYNRAVLMPPIDRVATFPLVEEAMAGPAKGDVPSSAQSKAEKLTQELEKLRAYLSPAPGQYFLAVGIKFNSFKLIDSFALLAVSFGEHFEVDVLGLSTMILPTPEGGQKVTPLAELRMVLKATFDPDHGFLGVQAQLTPDSYILSGDCHLTGGFAFYTWFAGEHSGDFVVTLGGYHPAFKVPAHYPQVPRLEFHWQVDSHLSLWGDAYAALTPTALMAGGHLQALWQKGSLTAWFSAGADFLIAWKPYHYDARVYVDLGVSYTFHLFGTHHITVDVGADLHIWGPEFAGTAHIHLWIISFDVSFGPGGRQAPQPIDWVTFKASFLPAPEQICTIAVQNGLIRQIKEDDEERWIINPKELVLATNSVIPSKSAQSGSEPSEPIKVDGANTKFGIGPMGVPPSDSLRSVHTITITRDGKSVEEEFEFRPILKNVPAGLWGQSLTPDLKAEALIKGVLSGFEIRPQKPHQPGETQPFPRSNLQYEIEPIANAYYWEELPPFKPSSLEEAPRREKIKDSIEQVNGKRESLLKALGVSEEISEEINVGQSIAYDFLIAPQIEESSGG